MISLQRLDLDDTNLTSLTAEQMAQADSIALEEYGINLLQMMELAGFQLAKLCGEYVKRGGKILVLAGSGHNGGGGLVAAKHLYNWGFQVSIFLTSKTLKPTTQHQLNILEKLALRIVNDLPQLTEFDLLVDSILGYNVKGEVREPIKSIIDGLNSSKVPIISLDLPSGLNPNTGKAEGVAVKATATLTLAASKVGLLKQPAKPFVGELYLADIGIPKEVFKRL